MAHVDHFKRLNEEFYANNPSTYFRDRLQMLVLRAANPKLIDENITENTVWGQLRVTAVKPADDSPEAAAKAEAEHSRFLVTESEVILHHVAEALLRMYLAHEGAPECPWLEIAAMQVPRKFREELEELAATTWPEDRMKAAGWVFLGNVPEDPSEEWVQLRDAAVRLLRALARRVNEDSQLYNSAKHGFTALGGSSSMFFLPADPTQPVPEFTAELIEREAVQFANGVSISFLERTGTRREGNVTWHHKTQWVNPERTAYLAQLAIIQMEALWTVARRRYVPDASHDDGVHLVTHEALDLLKKFDRSGGPGQSFRTTVATETVDR